MTPEKKMHSRDELVKLLGLNLDAEGKLNPLVYGSGALLSSKDFRTTDLKQIDEWWSNHPEANIGFCPGDCGQVVVVLKGQAGIDAWARLQRSHGAALDTYTVRTPEGDLHLCYAAPNFPTTMGKLAKSIDTIAEDDHVLLPPSRTEHGEYVALHDRPIAPAPQWLLKLATQ